MSAALEGGGGGDGEGEGGGGGGGGGLALSGGDPVVLSNLCTTLSQTHRWHASSLSYEEFRLLKRLLTWPTTSVFPVLDLLRLVAAHPDGASKVSRHGAVGSGVWAVGSGVWAVGSGQWAVGSGVWAVGSRQCSGVGMSKRGLPLPLPLPLSLTPNP